MNIDITFLGSTLSLRDILRVGYGYDSNNQEFWSFLYPEGAIIFAEEDVPPAWDTTIQQDGHELIVRIGDTKPTITIQR